MLLLLTNIRLVLTYTGGRGVCKVDKSDTLLSAAEQGEEKAQVPTPEIQDKVHFIFNNLSASNLTLKT